MKTFDEVPTEVLRRLKHDGKFLRKVAKCMMDDSDHDGDIKFVIRGIIKHVDDELARRVITQYTYRILTEGDL